MLQLWGRGQAVLPLLYPQGQWLRLLYNWICAVHWHHWHVSIHMGIWLLYAWGLLQQQWLLQLWHRGQTGACCWPGLMAPGQVLKLNCFHLHLES